MNCGCCKLGVGHNLRRRTGRVVAQAVGCDGEGPGLLPCLCKWDFVAKSGF
jgi:hypothetical protein